MRTFIYRIAFVLLTLVAAQTLSAQSRRPIDSKHPLWIVHVDVWNQADPQKIIDLIPDDIKPYVCMNLSLSCSYDTEHNVYKMPRCAVRTYKSWATVCQQNGLWFMCQPASGGHTHIQDDDLETFEYFFKKYPNFLGWNYAEQFWGFDEAGDKSSSTQASRIALFAKLVPMAHQYGGLLTVSFCGNIWSHPLNPVGMMKRNADLLKACEQYPEAILWLYKYTTSSCFYNNESVTFSPFVSGLAKNYGVRYDNCGWDGALDELLGKDHGKKYPTSAGIGTVMEQTCVNGGAVWDGPELIWTQDFQNKNNTTTDGYTRRNWGTFAGFNNVWIDMFRKVIDGTMYIPTREEVVNNTKIVVINDKSTGSDEDKYAAWGNLYDGLYKQTDAFNRNNGQWMDNFCYFKKTGRYGTIPVAIELYDELAKSIPVQVKKSNYTSRWSTLAKKVADFDSQYPEVSTGDLYVNRYKNQLVTYTPYTYLNSKVTASADIPLQYNTCETLRLEYGKLSSGVVREYADHIDFYLNNYRSDSTTQQIDKIIITGVSAEPTYTATRRASAGGIVAKKYDEEAKTFTLTVRHMGPYDITVNCTGSGTDRRTDVLSHDALTTDLPKQPEKYTGEVIIEAEDMDYRMIKSVYLTNAGVWYPDVHGYAGNGWVEMGTNVNGSLRHQLKANAGGSCRVTVRYSSPTGAGQLTGTLNGVTGVMNCEQTEKNEWKKTSFTATLNEGANDLVIANSGGVNVHIDQVIYTPAETATEKFKVTVAEAEHGRVEADMVTAAEGETVTLTIHADEGYGVKELRLTNSVFFTQDVTIPVSANDNQVTFVMPDDNVTIQPKFYDMTAVYALDYSSALAGTLPTGWRTVQGGSETHSYPASYGQGSRIFAGFNGYQGKALYWREVSAEYGRQDDYQLTLSPGDYKLSYAMAAWKGSPYYKVRILNGSDGVLASDGPYLAAPNVNGSATGDVASATVRQLEFTVTETGNYVISFVNNNTDFSEFLLLDCRLNTVGGSAGIGSVRMDVPQQESIHSLMGVKRSSLQRGLNIVRTADGKTRKIIVK
ncbi:MAG: glycosyl hydrolase family 98 [Prevotella sp.]|nr:glycosyl hydrolase family 98 [Prevotella sp.]